MGDRALVRRRRGGLHGRALGLAAVREQGAPAARGRPGVASAGAEPVRDVRAPVGVDGSDRWRSSTGHATSRTAGSTCRGSPRGSPREDGARCVTEISGDDGRVVAVVHDPALRGRPDVPRRRAGLGAEGARARAPQRRVAQLAARAQGVPCAHHVGRGQGASADRTRPSRRRPAVPGRTADQARAGRRAVEGKPGQRRAAAGRSSARRSTRRSSRSGRLRAGSTRHCWPIAGSGRRCALLRCAARFGPPSTRTASGATAR